MRVNEKIDFQAICAEFSLADIAAKAGVKLKRTGREYSGCCPFHSENTPSFTIYNAGDRDRFKCFGCGAAGDVIEFVAQYNGVDLAGAVEILKGIKSSVAPAPVRAPARNDDQVKISRARELYRAGRPAAGTLVETYLRDHRGIDLDKIGGIPATLRFGNVKFWAAKKGYDRPVDLGEYPAMLAPIQKADSSVTGVHITYLDPVTGAKLWISNPDNEKKSLPAKKIRGVKKGGCIRLGPAGPRLIIAEGIETALTVRMATVGTTMEAPVWTCVDLDNFSVLRLPLFVTEILFTADNDMNIPRHRSKDRNTRLVIMEAARRLSGMGCRVKIAWADGGADFNDMLNKTGAS